MRTYTFLVISTLLTLTFSSCYDTVELPPAEYNNIQEANLIREGQTMEYKVDSTFYVESYKDSVRKSTQYFQEKVTEKTTDSQGNTIYIITQSVRKDTSEPYQTISSFYYRVSNDELIEQRNNAPLLLLTSPIIKEKKWNAIKYTSTDFIEVPELNPIQKIWESEVIAVDSSYKPTEAINGSTESIDKATYVLLADITDGGSSEYTDRLLYSYVFAPNIGIIQRTIEAYVIRSSIKYRRGYKLEYNLISYE